MSRNLRLRVSVLLSICLGGAAASVSAADLRSSIDERTIVRTVSTQQVSETELEPTIEFEPTPGYAMDGPQDDNGYLPGCSSCGQAACGCYEQTWAGVEYLMWWRNGRFFPALVTTQPNAGVLPNATVLFGGDAIQEVARPGGRLEVGHWFGPGECLGIGGHLVMVADSPVSMTLTSNELTFFARPFFNAALGNTPDAQAISSNLSTPTTRGRLDLNSGSEVTAADFFVRYLLWRNCAARLDLLGGYQFARISENLFIDTFTQVQPSGFPSIAVHDAFTTSNEYNAGHVGFLGEFRTGEWGLELMAKFAFGNMRQTATIAGSTTTASSPTDTNTTGVGLLARSTNSGVYSQDSFSFMEDVGVKLAYYPVERLKLSLGYSLMYWSSVLRPGDQIDLSVNLQSTTPAQPAFAFDPSRFIIHGLNIGAELRF